MHEKDKASHYQELAEKWLNRTITPEEEILFNEWYHSSQDSPVQIPVEFASSDQVLKQRIFNEIQAVKTKQRRKIRLYRYVAAAASVSIVIALFMIYPSGKQEESLAKTPFLKQKINGQILPGSDKAILSLADGSELILDNSTIDDSLAIQGNARLKKVNGQLIYQSTGKPRAENLLNTITTPKGGQYHVVLSDGTKVWLNAASSLKFPASFSGSERKVELKGEAYFEVSHLSSESGAKMPFKVKVNEMEVLVLGTHFNVKAYDDESDIRTTLLEGSVKLSTKSKSALLEPGQQGRVGVQGEMNVLSDINVAQAVAWKNGLFEFNDNIRDIMRQISRWYDVEVEYTGNVTDKSFGGAIARKENISEVLKFLEMTGSIHFNIEGKKIKVMP